MIKIKAIRTFYLDGHLAIFLHNDFLRLIDEDLSSVIRLDEISMSLFGEYLETSWGKEVENVNDYSNLDSYSDMIYHHDTLLGKYRGKLIECTAKNAKKYSDRYVAIIQCIYETLSSKPKAVKTNEPTYQELT